jgi:hypothetical protein
MKFNLCLFSPLLEDGLFLRYTVAKIADITERIKARQENETIEWVLDIAFKSVLFVVVLVLICYRG